jgi:hypothetical protein
MKADVDGALPSKLFYCQPISRLEATPVILMKFFSSHPVKKGMRPNAGPAPLRA